MKQRIVVERGEVNELHKLFKCSRQMVTYSLSFKKNSFLARKIRKAAMERGGIDTGCLNHDFDKIGEINTIK
ncbi:ArsR family transcriptional regulator [Viscerimonas tarda]